MINSEIGKDFSPEKKYLLNKGYRLIEWDRNRYLSSEPYDVNVCGLFTAVGEEWVDVDDGNRVLTVIELDGEYYTLGDE